MELPEIFQASKTLPLRPSWIQQEGDRVSLASPLDIDGVTVEGLRLRLSAQTPMVDECVIAQIEYISPKRDVRGGALARIEWKPLKGHNNKNCGPLELRNKTLVGSHYHRFDLNWNDQSAALRRGNLPIAIELNPDPANFERLIDLVKQEFRIENLDWLQPPPWQARLV